MIGPESRPREPKPLDLSDQEVERLKDAFKSSEFRKLFADYAEEISDPKNRELYEKEILTLEAERGTSGAQFLKTEPGLCIKTRFTSQNPSVSDEPASQTTKVFINICTSTQIAPPTREITLDPKGTGKQGTSWKIPYAMAGTGREDKDRKGEPAMVYDCVFHPDIMSRVSKHAVDAPFTNLVISTAMEGVQKCSKKKLEKKFTMPKNLKYKGNQPTTLLREPSSESVCKVQPDVRDRTASDSCDSFDEKSPKSFLAELERRGREPILPHGILSTNKPSTASYLIEELPEATNQLPATGGSKIRTPVFNIINRGKFDLANHTESRVKQAIPGRPEELVVRVELPLVNSAGRIQLDITERKFVLLVPEIYELEHTLPFPVDQDRGSAKFDKGSRRLEVVLPIHPAEAQHLPPTKDFEDLEPVKDDEEGEDHGHDVPEGDTEEEGERKKRITHEVPGIDANAEAKLGEVSYNENEPERSNVMEGKEIKSGDTDIKSENSFKDLDSTVTTLAIPNATATKDDSKQGLTDTSKTAPLALLPTRSVIEQTPGTPPKELYADSQTLPCAIENSSQIIKKGNSPLLGQSTEKTAEGSVSKAIMNSSIFHNDGKGKGRCTIDFTEDFENSMAYELE